MQDLAQLVETEFLKNYFGTDPQILDFARHLIQTGEKKAAKALNAAVRVLGSGVPPKVVITQISADFDLLVGEERAKWEKQRSREQKHGNLGQWTKMWRAREGSPELVTLASSKEFINLLYAVRVGLERKVAAGIEADERLLFVRDSEKELRGQRS